MRARSKTLLKRRWVALSSHTSATNGRKHYSISVFPYEIKSVDLSEIRNHFDPNLSRGGKFSSSWKFSNRHDAEQLIITALLKWGG